MPYLQLLQSHPAIASFIFFENRPNLWFQSSEKLKAINAAMRSPPSGGGPRHSQKRLKFDAGPDGNSNGVQ